MMPRIHHSILGKLTEQPHRFGFFQAVRLMHAYFRRAANTQDDADELIGERIRFGASVSTTFPASEIEKLVINRSAAPYGEGAGNNIATPSPRDGESTATTENHHSGEPGETPIESVQLTAGFFGLLGHQGTLPTHYTEKIAEREIYERDRSSRRFLEIFSNRATALMYGAWKKYRLDVHYEQGRKQTFMPLVHSLAGISPAIVNDAGKSQLLKDEVMARYAGLLRQRPVSAAHLQRTLSDYFAMPVRVQQFVGAWYVVPDSQRTRLGGSQARLGQTALCGARIWQRNLRARLWFGPLNRTQYDSLLPQGAAQHELRQWLGMLTGHTIEYEICPILHQEAVQGSTLAASRPVRLGLDSFMTTRPATQHRTDIRYLMRLSA